VVQLTSVAYVRRGAALHCKLLCRDHRRAENHSRQQQQHPLTLQLLHCKLLLEPLYPVASGEQQVHAGAACFALACGHHQQPARPLLTVASTSQRIQQQQQQQQVLTQRASHSVCTSACRVSPLHWRPLLLLQPLLLRLLLQRLVSPGQDP
jgi:hypothetical protein